MKRSEFLKSLIATPALLEIAEAVAKPEPEVTTMEYIIVKGMYGKFKHGEVIRIASMPNRKFIVSDLSQFQVAEEIGGEKKVGFIFKPKYNE